MPIPRLAALIDTGRRRVCAQPSVSGLYVSSSATVACPLCPLRSTGCVMVKSKPIGCPNGRSCQITFSLSHVLVTRHTQPPPFHALIMPVSCQARPLPPPIPPISPPAPAVALVLDRCTRSSEGRGRTPVRRAGVGRPVKARLGQDTNGLGSGDKLRVRLGVLNIGGRGNSRGAEE